MRILLMIIGFPLLVHAVEPTAGWNNCGESHRPVIPALWREDFSEKKLSDFDVEYRNGATGNVEIVTGESGNASRALKITKTNTVGSIIVTPKKVPVFKIGTELQTYVSVKTLHCVPNYSLGAIRLRDEYGYSIPAHKLEGDFAGGVRMTDLLYSSPGRWEHKLCQQRVDQDSGTLLTPLIIVSGAPSASIWDNWGVEDYQLSQKAWREYQKKSEPQDYSADRIPEDEFEHQLAADHEHTSQVVKKDGRVVLLIDGKESPAILYKGMATSPTWNNLSVFSGKFSYAGRRMQEAGLNIQCVGVRLGALGKIGGPYAQGFWSPKGFDAKGAVASLRNIMRTADKSLFFLSINLSAYPEFSQEHPDEVWIRADGKPVYGSYVLALPRNAKTVPKFYWPWISNHSLVWRDAVKRCIAELVAELQRTGLGKRIIGIHIGGYNDGQFGTAEPDYSKPAIKAFRRWLAERYKTDEVLRRAWKKEKITLETVDAPKFGDNTWFDPSVDQDKIDFVLFLKHAPFRLQEDIVRFTRKCFGKPLASMRYCQTQFGGYFVTAYDVSPFLYSKDIDILVAQPSYERRSPGLSLGLLMPITSFVRHGKLFVNEFDLRSYGAPNVKEIRMYFLGLARDFAEWQSVHHKMVGQMLAARQGYWYYDMAGGWFTPREIAEDIKNTTRIYRQISLEKAVPLPVSAAVVIDETGLLLRNLPTYFTFREERLLLGMQTEFLAASGVPYDMLMMEELLRDPSVADRYRVVVFAGMYHMDANRRKAVERLKNSGRTLVFLAATGNCGGAEATGFNPKGVVSDVAEHEIQAEPGEVNMLSPMCNNFIYHQLRQPGSFKMTRFFVPTGKDIKVHARYQKSKDPAVVSRRLADYRAVYIGSYGGLTPEFFNQLVRDAGGYVPISPGVQVDMNGNFVSLHCLVPGNYRFVLPTSGKVVNLKSGKEEKVDVDGTFQLNLTAGETCWFRLR